MKKKILVISGVALFAMLMALNLQYALDGYGISKNSLHMEVLAQTSTSGGGSTTGGGGSTTSGSDCPTLKQLRCQIFEYNYYASTKYSCDCLASMKARCLRYCE